MTPLEALQILDNVASGVQLNRADHAKVTQAIQTLLKLVQDDMINKTSSVPTSNLSVSESEL